MLVLLGRLEANGTMKVLGNFSNKAVVAVLVLLVLAAAVFGHIHGLYSQSRLTTRAVETLGKSLEYNKELLKQRDAWMREYTELRDDQTLKLSNLPGLDNPK